METLKRLTVAWLTALWLFHGALVAEEQPDRELFPPDQIEQLVAPIALYPDALLAQLLMASTYPLDLVQAARWLKGHPDLEGEALEQATEAEPWDQSVKTLVFFPDVLDYMNDNLDWTQDLGDAMLAQDDDVMDAVQRLRKEAQDAGNLQTTEQQQVETEGDTIVVQPADPQVVYVPAYNPSTVYGQTAPPATTYYPATYTTPTTTYVTDSGSSSSDNLVSFGVGALVGGLLTAAILWDRNDYRVYYGGRGYYGRPGYWNNPGYWGGGWRRPENINRNVNIQRGDVNINRGIVGNDFTKWEHNPERRGGVRYRNQETKQKYAGARQDNRIDRDAARGRDRQGQPDLKRPETRDVKRPATQEAKRPASGDVKRPQSREAKRPAPRETKRPESRDTKRAQTRDQKQRPQTREVKRPASREVKAPAKRDGGRSSAFKVDRSGLDRAASKRGSSSRGGGAAKRGGGGGARGGGRSGSGRRG
ncbi:MAG: DUF3300 domain-containing protein [Pseudomonadota bacterium]|nr:DUF3300 domain-containing protein [Pseudomonadota bacterium]